MIWTFALVTLGWVLFRASGLKIALGMWMHMLQPWRSAFLAGIPHDFLIAGLSLPGLLAVHVWSYRIYGRDDHYSVCKQMPYWARCVVLSLLCITCIFFAGTPTEFIYFQF